MAPVARSQRIGRRDNRKEWSAIFSMSCGRDRVSERVTDTRVDVRFDLSQDVHWRDTRRELRCVARD